MILILQNATLIYQMNTISKGITSFINTFSNSTITGKLAIGCSALFFMCICFSVTLSLFSNISDSKQTVDKQQVNQVDLTAIYATAQGDAWSSITQTALIHTPLPTDTPTIAFTLTPDITSTLTVTAQVTLPASVASCLPQNTPRETALVVGIVDGDTIDVQINKQTYRLRYIGMDTPERSEALFGPATLLNQNLVYSKTVTLIKDVSETDKYDRILRYVLVGDTFVNYELVRQGYAKASTYPPDVACSEFFANAQGQAQSEKKGLWLPLPTQVKSAVNLRNCDPSYPGVCIPPPPPDLDCKDISYRRFQVLPPDPHHFDGDGDGIGCES
jgi:micrococcal nuclease